MTEVDLDELDRLRMDVLCSFGADVDTTRERFREALIDAYPALSAELRQARARVEELESKLRGATHAVHDAVDASERRIRTLEAELALVASEERAAVVKMAKEKVRLGRGPMQLENCAVGIDWSDFDAALAKREQGSSMPTEIETGDSGSGEQIMTRESLIEWAAHWVPDSPPGQRTRFIEALRAELANWTPPPSGSDSAAPSYPVNTSYGCTDDLSSLSTFGRRR